MKKTLKISALICCAAVLVFALTACFEGKSAYDIAVDNGFSGTEAEWLESLKSSSVTTSTTVNYTVDGSSSSVTAAANIGLKSAVSVYSYFTKTSTSWYYRPSQQTTTSYSVAGSGVFYQVNTDGSALIITNHHVVYDNDSDTSDHISDEIYVFLYGMENNSSYAITATYVGGSMYYDLAVLYVEPNDILKEAVEKGTAAAVEFADSEDVHVGETSIAIGNPEAEGISVSSGIISVDSEYITMTAVDEVTEITLRVVRTDTAVNSGNSGGGLYDVNGKLIGIVNAKMNTDTAENIAYAIPSNLVLAVVNNIIDYCYGQACVNVMRPMLGISVQASELSTELDEEGLITKIEAVEVVSITSSGVANGKLEIGDIIKKVTVDGHVVEVTHTYQIGETLLYARSGDTVTLEIERDGETQTVQIEITSDAITSY